MGLSGAIFTTLVPSLPFHPGGKCPIFVSLQYQNQNVNQIQKQKGGGEVRKKKKGRNNEVGFVLNAVSSTGDQDYVINDVPFPADYSQLLRQAKEATESAIKNKVQLMEIEFPTSGLQSVPGDGEGGNEMTYSMQLIRDFCDRLVTPEKSSRTRIFFPEASEVMVARKSVFEGVSFKLDYLTKPSFLSDFGFGTKIKMADRVRPEDELFLVAYPYFNVNEMLVVEELYKEAVANSSRQLIVFNGELDRIRSGYYPAFFYPKLATLTKTLLPKMETVYYIHNFKGRNGGTLFRAVEGSKNNRQQIHLRASARNYAIP
ncbi:hypothetical protein RND81_06G211100 [Saponaria officinalis]|uniref:DUF1995 domain-containing protein n=1 Tax=Saponaria officinalis TaxID=3572 RepID=A0AAW1KDG7_SAPOF